MKPLSIHEDNLFPKTKKPFTKYEAEQLLGIPLDDFIRYTKKKYDIIKITFYENCIEIFLVEYYCVAFWRTETFTYPEFINIAKLLNEDYKTHSKKDFFK